MDGRTIRLHAPPAGTVKILPGWLEVLSPEETVKQILFYRLKDRADSAVTFGRSPGEPYTHVQLKPQTVSARQARIGFEHGQATLTNLASAESNLTRINGREMREAESCPLQEGDLVEMGEVRFRFHQR